MSYFTRSHVWNWYEIISAAKWVPKLFHIYISDIERVGKYSRAAIILGIISGIIERLEIKLFHTDIDQRWNNFEITSNQIYLQAQNI